eukprot:2602633-Amphidinium_carterae.1
MLHCEWSSTDSHCNTKSYQVCCQARKLSWMRSRMLLQSQSVRKKSRASLISESARTRGITELSNYRAEVTIPIEKNNHVNVLGLSRACVRGLVLCKGVSTLWSDVHCRRIVAPISCQRFMGRQAAHVCKTRETTEMTNAMGGSEASVLIAFERPAS